MRILIVVIFLLTAIYSFGQSGDYCGKKNKLKLSDIKKRTPFDKTQTIRLVSFKHEYRVMQESDTVQIPFTEPEIPKTNGTVDLTKMFESKVLDLKLTNRVLDVLVNYDNEDRGGEVRFCYEPRNGIVFIDKTDRVIGFVEICFDCLGYKVEPPTLSVTNFCTDKFEALKSIFKESGIVYGTVRSPH